MSHRYRSSCCCGENPEQSPCLFGWGTPPKTQYNPNLRGEVPIGEQAEGIADPQYTDADGKKLQNIHDNWEFCADSTEDELAFVIERKRSRFNYEIAIQHPDPDTDPDNPCPCTDGPQIASNTQVGIEPPTGYGDDPEPGVAPNYAPIIARYRHTWTADQREELPYGDYKRSGNGLPDRASELYQYTFSSARIGANTGFTRTNRLYPLESGQNAIAAWRVTAQDLGWPTIKYPYSHYHHGGTLGAGTPCYCAKKGPFGCYDTLCAYNNFFSYCQGGVSGFTHLSPNFGLPCTIAQSQIIGISGAADMWRTSNFGYVNPERQGGSGRLLREYEVGGSYFWLQGIAEDITRDEEGESCYYDFGIAYGSLDITYIPRNGPFEGNARLHQTLLGVIHREKWYQLYYNSLLVEHNQVDGDTQNSDCDTYLKGDDSEEYSNLFSPQAEWFGYPPTNTCTLPEDEQDQYGPRRQDGEDVFNNRVPKYWIQSCAGVPIFSWEIALNETLLETHLSEVMDNATISTLADAFKTMIPVGSAAEPLSITDNLKNISVARYLMLIFNGFPFWYAPPDFVIPTGVITPGIARLLAEEGILPNPENGGLENAYKIYKKTMKVADNCAPDEETPRGLCCFNAGPPSGLNCFGPENRDENGEWIEYTTESADGCPLGEPPDTEEEQAACEGCVEDDPPCGCVLPACNQVVCATNPECCDQFWDATCAGIASGFAECQIEFAGCIENTIEDECRWYGGQWTPNPEGEELVCASSDGYEVCIANAKGTCSRRCPQTVPIGDCGCSTFEHTCALDSQDHPPADGILNCYNDCANLGDNEPACVCFETYKGLRDENDKVGEGGVGSTCADNATDLNPCGSNNFTWLSNTNCINTNGLEVTPVAGESDIEKCAPRCGALPPAPTQFSTTEREQWFYGQPGGWFHADFDGDIYATELDTSPLVSAENHQNLFPQFLSSRNMPRKSYAAGWPQYQECTFEQNCSGEDCTCDPCASDYSQCLENLNCDGGTISSCYSASPGSEDNYEDIFGSLESTYQCDHEGSTDTCRGTWLQYMISGGQVDCAGGIPGDDEYEGAYSCNKVNNASALKTTPWLVNTGDGTKIFKNVDGDDLEGWKPSVAFDDPSITPFYDDDGSTGGKPRVDWFYPPLKATPNVPSSTQTDPCCWTTPSGAYQSIPDPRNGTSNILACPIARGTPNSAGGIDCLSINYGLGEGELPEPGETGDYCGELECGFLIRDSQGEYDIDPACGKICEPDDNENLRFCCPYTGQCVPVGTDSSVCTQCASDCETGTQCCMLVDDQGRIYADCVPEGECQDIGTTTP